MKLTFEPDLDFQLQAIQATCDLFRGQEICRSEFTVTIDPQDQQQRMGFAETDLGIGNRLTLLDNEVHDNLKDIQLRNGLRPSDSLSSGDFTIEMETGTGKTYVYLRTIFELNKLYGFTKFVIVVPSVAIKEGVYKSLQIMEAHFRSLYANEPFEYFLYDSSKLGQVRNYATSSTIQIMVVTVGAINKRDVNNIYGKGANEQTGGEKPIDLIRSTNPVMIVDEPQSVDGGLSGKGKEALNEMNPLCTLRYSATHVDKHHMLYRLDAVDAYERKLVKQIEVASATVEGGFNKPYVKLLGVKNVRNRITAQIEMDKQKNGRVVRETETVQDGDNLQLLTGRDLYADYIIGEIRVAKGDEFMELRYPGGEVFLEVGAAVGDVEKDGLSRLMIRRTIKEHLDKELRLAPQGIKVLSLFFIDSVVHYRSYDADGREVPGKYQIIFEEEYRRLAKHPDYRSLFKEVDIESDASEVHQGYFSIDKKGKSVDTSESNQSGRDDAERGYNLIMREKEKLLSFDTKLKFIFSHSALKEGWDNPNVFQICALREIGTERERRQTIGRGLRLCVNQFGDRVRGHEVNTLTVIALESYQDFAENLQREIEKDTGIRFGIVEKHQFAAIPVKQNDGSYKMLGVEASENLWSQLKETGYVDARGKVQDKLRTALKDGAVELPEEYNAQRTEIKALLRKLAGKLDVKNADEKIQVKTRQAVLNSEEFKALWQRIRHKTTYRVDFDNDVLLASCTEALKNAPPVNRTRVTFRKADVSIGKGGIQTKETAVANPTTVEEGDIEVPDILTDLQDKTQLTRRSIVNILCDSGRLGDLKRNPQQFVELAAEFINVAKRQALVDGIKYQRLGDEAYYAQELFETEELHAYLKNSMETSERCLHERVVYDSAGIERVFAESLEKNESVKVYAKLPGWFRVPTPLGSYNPDWAVLIDTEEGERLYFVVETKGTLLDDGLRQKESAKIKCGEKHFEAIAVDDPPAKYNRARTVEDLMAHT